MKTITVIDALLVFFGIIQVSRAIYLSFVYGLRARTRSVAYLLSQDKIFFEKMMRALLFGALFFQMVYFLAYLNRILLGFPPFVSNFILYTSVFQCILICGVSNILYAMYDDKTLTALTNYFNRNKKKLEDVEAD